jgi:hypothetical protein
MSVVFDPILKWRLHQALVHRVGYGSSFPRRKSRKHVLFLSERDPISQTQLFPFFLYQNYFEENFGIEIRELPLQRFIRAKKQFSGELDAVLFQTWFDLNPSEMDDLISSIKKAWPSAAMAYLDWFAPTDLRYAAVLNQHITVYMKKQILADFAQYHAHTIGDTNLTDYYGRLFGIDLPITHFQIPLSFEQKILLGSGFEYSPEIVTNLARGWQETPRPVDVHARMATKGTDWYSKMRQEAAEAVQRLRSRLNVTDVSSVPKRQYLAELYSSKTCFSPFGYGEVCWRDFEAMSCGALLIKPDMSHLKLRNNPFKPFETYVPVKWDLSDLSEKLLHFAANEAERVSITRNAFDHLRSHLVDNRFANDCLELWQRLGIAS